MKSRSNDMKKSNWLWLMVAGALMAGPAFADDDSENGDDVTLEVIDSETTPEDIVKTITLPASASENGVANSAKGLETANAARAGGRAFGQGMAAGRGEAGRAFGESMAADRGEAGRAIGEAARDAAAGAARDARQNAADAASQGRNNANNRPGRGG
jgi:hypothetical protein